MILFVLVVILILLHIGGTLFIPLFFGFLTALLLYPVCCVFERLHLGKTFSAIITVVLFLTVLGSLLYFLSIQLQNLFQNLPNARVKFLAIVHGIENWVSAHFHVENKDQQTYMSRSLNNFLTGSLGTTFGGVLRMCILFVVFVFFTFFILVYRNLLQQTVLSFFKDSQQQEAKQMVRRIRAVINSYLLGLITEMGILFVLIFAALLILGVKYALLLALLGSIMNIIPYIGIYTAALIAILMTLLNTTEGLALDVAFVFIAAHLIDANILMPYIVGGRVKINPFMALVALIAGDLVWGIAGMFLFIPLTAIIRILVQNIRELRPWAILIGGESGTTDEK